MSSDPRVMMLDMAREILSCAVRDARKNEIPIFQHVFSYSRKRFFADGDQEDVESLEQDAVFTRVGFMSLDAYLKDKDGVDPAIFQAEFVREHDDERMSGQFQVFATSLNAVFESKWGEGLKCLYES